MSSYLILQVVRSQEGRRPAHHKHQHCCELPQSCTAAQQKLLPARTRKAPTPLLQQPGMTPADGLLVVGYGMDADTTVQQGLKHVHAEQ